MMRHRTICAVLLIGGLGWSASGPAVAQLPSSSPSAQSTTVPRSSDRPVGLEIDLLRSLQLNPITAPYGFSTERRGSKVALHGRVGTKQVHDSAIQTALAMGVPVIDDLVIDTLAVYQASAYQASAYQARMMAGMGDPSSGPSSGLGGYPGATSLYGSLPYTYPQPLFGRLDEPFYGFEPPAIGYPSWWGAMTAARLGPQGAPMVATGPQQPGSNANPADSQALNLPYGTIDMAIDPRGVATLRGTVPSLAERITLGQKVAQTQGVTQVVNLLNVRPGITVASADKPPPPPVPADLTAGAARTAPRPAPIDVPTPIDADADPIGKRANRALANRADLANQPVKVKVRDGVASLTGKVPTVYEAMLAYRAVQRTPGVREIEDRLEFVVPDGNGPNPLLEKGRPEDVEAYLEAQIRRQIGDLAHLDRVTLRGDSLDIRGTIEREEDRNRFDAILRSMPILRGFRLNAEMPAESR